MDNKPQPTTNLKISLNAAGLCKLIETCKKSGVRSLDYGDLHVSFEEKEEIQTKLADNIYAYRPEPEQKPFDIAESSQKDRAQELSDLMLSDPLAYEEAMAEEIDA